MQFANRIGSGCLKRPRQKIIFLKAIDDKRAKNEARRRNIPVITILNILETAAARNWLDLTETIHRLRHTNYYLPAQELIEEALGRDAQKKKDERPTR